MDRGEEQRRELEMDALLGVRTTGRDESHADCDNNPYEPTPYAVLERVASSGVVGKGNTLVDYGCGKGRVGFFLTYQLRCHVIGIERDEWLFEGARRNQATAARPARVTFQMADAATYAPPEQADRFYFFNPFSDTVFASALAGIKRSLDTHPREAAVILYYPDEGYLSLLDKADWLERDTTIDCRDLFGTDDPREAVIVYRTTMRADIS